MVDQIETYHHLQPHPLQTNQEDQIFHSYSASTLSPPDRSRCYTSLAEFWADCFVAPMSGASYEFPPNFDPPPTWDHSPFLSHSPQSLGIDRSVSGEASGTFWRPSGSPMTGAYAPSQYSMNSSSLSIAPSSQGSREAFFPQSARDDRNWQPPPAPMRSMSLVTPEELPAHYQARFLHQSSIAAGRGSLAAGVTTHPLYGQAAQNTIPCEPHSTTERSPLGHQERTGQPAGLGFPQQWGTYPQQNTQMAEPGAEGYSREWYAGSPNLAQVREEDGSLHHYQPSSRSSQHRQNPG